MTTRRPMRPIDEPGVYIPPKTKWEKFLDKIDYWETIVGWYLIGIILFVPAKIYLWLRK